MTWKDSYSIIKPNHDTTITNPVPVVYAQPIPNASPKHITQKPPRIDTKPYEPHKKEIENEKENTRSPDTKDTLDPIDLNMVARIAQNNGIVPHHLAGIMKYENGAMVRQARASLWEIYSKEKADKISAWCNNRKKAGTYPEWVDCKKEQSFGIAQINIWVHRSISIEQALDNEFSATWTAKRLIAKGYTTNKKLAIRLHNGFSESQANRNYADNVLSVARKITF